MEVTLNWNKINGKDVLLFIFAMLIIILFWIVISNVNSNVNITSTSEDTNQANEVDCKWYREQSIKLIEDWQSYLDYQNNVLKEQWCTPLTHEDIQWYPWVLSDDGTHQEMPELDLANAGSHERFKALANRYWLDAWTIRAVENKYHLQEWMILCIAITETSWGKRWAGENNIWNVGNNDRWDRVQYSSLEEALNKIWQTLNNSLLWSIQTLGCLSNGWSCIDKDNNWHRYATSNWNRERNMVTCLEDIYQTDIDASILSFRTNYIPYQILTVD